MYKLCVPKYLDISGNVGRGWEPARDWGRMKVLCVHSEGLCTHSLSFHFTGFQTLMAFPSQNMVPLQKVTTKLPRGFPWRSSLILHLICSVERRGFFFFPPHSELTLKPNPFLLSSHGHGVCSCIPTPPALTCSCLGCAAPYQSQPMPSGSVPDSSSLGPGPELRRCSWRYLISKMVAASINFFSIYIILSFFMWQCVKKSKNPAQLKLQESPIC